MDQRQAYNEAFTEVLAQLNPQQQRAVAKIEGPVLVVAGPGTGKTHILSARIGRILLDTDTQAANILCLTFTDAGVHAMRERLLRFIGPEAHRVHIYTFHSFCNTIIQDNLELFGRQDLEPISDLERVDIIRQLLDELPLEHPLRLGRNNPYFYEGHLRHLFQQMKAERWTPQSVQGAVQQYLETLPEREEFVYKISRGDFKKGDLKTAKIDAVETRMYRLSAAAKLYPRYQQTMRKKGRYDYDDMILWVLEAFRKHENLLRRYQEQYLYLLVDEYQDTNGAQNDIIRQLVAYWDNPNLFIVGDDDQSIYEFQGARLKNLLDFHTAYQPDLELVVLADNYRSSQAILDSARGLIDRNELRVVQKLGIAKVLKARGGTEQTNPPSLLRFPDRRQEEIYLAHQLQALQQEGYPLGEVAVIYAQHRQVAGLVELLEKKGVPYNLKRKVNILDLPTVRHFRTMLSYFQAEYRLPGSGEPLLYQMLHFRFLGIDPADIALLSARQAQKPWDERMPWRRQIETAIADTNLPLRSRDALQRLLSFSADLQQQINSLGVPVFTERLLNRSGLLGHLVALPDRAWWIQVFRAFSDFVRQEAARQPRLILADLLRLLERMDTNRIALPLTQTAQAEEGVHLVTAHSAKGLEFERVYLLDCTSRYWEPRSRGGNYRFPLPDTLTYSGPEDEMEARRRLFYVAMTRAKSVLQLSYGAADAAGKVLRPSLFVTELLTQDAIQEATPVLSAEMLLEADILRLQETEVPQITHQEKATVDALLEGFRLSVSAFNRYLRCPLAFYYENVLQAPVLMSAAAHYGTAMHYALQRLFERMKMEEQQRFPTVEQFVGFFEQEMGRRRAFFEAAAYERFYAAGQKHLANYYAARIDQWSKNVRLEYKPRNVEVDGVPLAGSIDKVELEGLSKATVVDYKTGSQSKSKLKTPSETDPHGGSYWRQLVFYKLLYEHYPGNTQTVSRGTIAYLEPDTNGQFLDRSISIRPQDAQHLRSLVKDTYQRIRAHDFYRGCNEPSCAWCQLLRHNAPPESFADAEVEGLDD